MDDIVKEIEHNLVDSRKQRLSFIPKNIRKQLEKIEKMVNHQFELGSEFDGHVQLSCFDAVMDSRMTLNELESIFKSSGKKLSEERDFDSALKYIVKTVSRSKKMSAFKNTLKNNRILKSLVSGN